MNSLVDVLDKIRRNGIVGSARKLHRRLRRRGARRFWSDLPMFGGLRGVEIGGPSPWVFGPESFLPVYPCVGELDNVNFAQTTVWERSMHAGNTFRFDPRKRPGMQYITDATDLSPIASDVYDFLLSSHTLEHVANPIKALSEWIRVVKTDGLFLIVLPEKHFTFDRYRPTTPLEHMIEDFRAGRGEDDLTHMDESVRLHDYSMTPEIPDPVVFKARSLKNVENRCLHHHTFTQKSTKELLDYVGLEIIKQDTEPPFHLIVLARVRKPNS